MRRTQHYLWQVPTDDEFIRLGAQAIGELGDQIDSSLDAERTARGQEAQTRAAEDNKEAQTRAAEDNKRPVVTHTHGVGSASTDLKIYANSTTGYLKSFFGSLVVPVAIPAHIEVLGVMALGQSAAEGLGAWTTLTAHIVQNSLEVHWPSGQGTVGHQVAIRYTVFYR